MNVGKFVFSCFGMILMCFNVMGFLITYIFPKYINIMEGTAGLNMYRCILPQQDNCKCATIAYVTDIHLSLNE